CSKYELEDECFDIW
nr:immunoglobulin heavy chain junction region [Macaca mulatta]MOV54282.1 immunoglobulin heavy chain junction region [Macaca mulatta]MOV55113.1 immunoglobulin heavy chain junction region [Macaca mulatta]MOV55250.1 immunoglobulin heavy chain junction region [Macaca mulatta]MOV58312.1 immunoglobulin heavy chain junction region [Macaca mulatta]